MRYLILGILLLGVGNSDGKEGESAKLARTAMVSPWSPKVSEAVEVELSAGKLAGAVVLVAQSGAPKHLGAYGLRSLESGESMTVDTIFRIHSMTKAIVSAAALQQWEEGKFQLDDLISKYLPAFSEMKVWSEDGSTTAAGDEITVKDLFRHTSGLAYGFTAPEELVGVYSSPKLWGGDLGQFCDELAKIPLVHEPGQSWRYGVNTDVLGRLVEIWSGQPLDEYLQSEFFDPLKMTSTGFMIKEGDQVRFASVHSSGENGVTAGEDPLGQKYLLKPKMNSGGGGLVSTAMDYYQFLQMIADGGERFVHQFLKSETVELMTTNQLPDSVTQIFFDDEQRTKIGFGLGFSVVTGPSEGWDEAAPINEFGWGGAASCHYWVSPDDDNLIVITLEQTVPYNWNLERAMKPLVYELLGQ